MRSRFLNRCVNFLFACLILGILYYYIIILIKCSLQSIFCSIERSANMDITTRRPVPGAPMKTTTTNKPSLTSAEKTVRSKNLLWSPKEEIDYPLAFYIWISYNPEQAAQMFRLIYRPHNAYCIYIDETLGYERVESEFRRLIADVLVHPGDSHVIFLTKKERNPAGNNYYSALHGNLECAWKLFNYRDRVVWQYLFILSDRYLPLRTNWELVRALKAMKGSNSIEIDDLLPLWKFGIGFYYGYKVLVLRHEFVHFVFTDSLAREVNRLIITKSWSVTTGAFYSTLAGNTKAPGSCQQIIIEKDEDIRTLIPGNLGLKYVNCTLENWISNCQLEIPSFHQLKAQPHFFFHRFSLKIELEVEKKLSQWIVTKNKFEKNKKQLHPSFNVSIYENLYCTKSHYDTTELGNLF